MLSHYTCLIWVGEKQWLSGTVKYLSLVLDSKLSWKYHLDDRLQKAQMAYAQSRRAIARTWGLFPKAIYWLYTVVRLYPTAL